LRFASSKVGVGRGINLELKMFSNMEPLLDRWISDNGFRAALQNDPARAARDVGVSLTSEEEEALRAVDWSQSDGDLTARVSKCAGM
jgi:predicted unusual protein kinase regulating ubiquinone biosynthesis (AarF/ABC1/UbiB family)